MLGAFVTAHDSPLGCVSLMLGMGSWDEVIESAGKVELLEN